MNNEIRDAHLQLWELAKRDTGQAMKVRRFLLGLFDGMTYPFDLTSLRSLDDEIFDACIKILSYEQGQFYGEIHTRIGITDIVFLSVLDGN